MLRRLRRESRWLVTLSKKRVSEERIRRRSELAGSIVERGVTVRKEGNQGREEPEGKDKSPAGKS